MLRGMSALDELARPVSAYIRRFSRAIDASATPGTAGGLPPAGEDRRFALLRSVGEECQTEKELQNLLDRKPDFILYDGFEPSGRMHIAQGVFKSINVNKCTRAGGTFIFWVADWFALMNDKMGGDLEKIKTVGKYLVEVWKAAGMDMTRVKFLWCEEQITSHAKQYWGQALDIARRTTLARIKKCCQIMGRAEDKLTAAQILYPIMQCTDIFFLKADICQLGVDQRKVNMLARDYCDASGRKTKPIILSHHMLFGLQAGQAKMSKSNAESAIFMEDTAEDVRRKITNAYCPLVADQSVVQQARDEDMQVGDEKDDLMNPCLDYLKYILYSDEKFVFTVGSKTYSTFEEAKAAFLLGEITEETLKNGLIDEINKLLEPVRQHFKNDPVAKELLAKVSQWKKENLVKTASMNKLKIVDPKDGPVFAVFAPHPQEAVHLEAVLAVLQCLREAPGSGCQLILWLEDWSARALGRLGSSEDCISGFYELLLHGLRTLAPELMQRVRVVWQGEAILSGPSEYWISVINAGRWASIEDIRTALPEGEQLEYASQVVTSLMHVGDILALCEGTEVTLCCSSFHSGLHQLASKYCEVLDVKAPRVNCVGTQSLRLMQPGEGVEADVNISLTDKDTDVNRKVKKAFCQPQNVSFCPPIDWVSALLFLHKDFTVVRKPDNGGDKCYSDPKAIWEDFESGALHPGDLKPAVGKMLNATLDLARAGLQDVDVLKKAQKDLTAFIKAASKKK